jgi:hypothetical protein
MTHLFHLGIHLKIPSQKTLCSCIHTHSQTAISTPPLHFLQLQPQEQYTVNDRIMDNGPHYRQANKQLISCSCACQMQVSRRWQTLISTNGMSMWPDSSPFQLALILLWMLFKTNLQHESIEKICRGQQSNFSTTAATGWLKSHVF